MTVEEFGAGVREGWQGFLHSPFPMKYNPLMAGRGGTFSPDSFHNFGELLRCLRGRALQVGYHYSLSRVEKKERMPDTATLMARFVPAFGREDDPRWTAAWL